MSKRTEHSHKCRSITSGEPNTGVIEQRVEEGQGPLLEVISWGNKPREVGLSTPATHSAQPSNRLQQNCCLQEAVVLKEGGQVSALGQKKHAIWQEELTECF